MSTLPGPQRYWEPDGKPAQVGFSPDGRTLVVTERGADRILTFAVEPSGSLGEPLIHASAGNNALRVRPHPHRCPGRHRGLRRRTRPVSRLLLRRQGLLPEPGVPLDRQRPHGALLGRGHARRAARLRHQLRGRRRVPVRIDPDGALTLGEAAAAPVDGAAGPRDVALSVNGRFLYALDADTQQIVSWSVGHAGALDPLGSWPGLPAAAAGIAAS